MQIQNILQVAVQGGASDVILKTGSKPRFRYNGQLVSLTDGATIDAALMENWVEQILPPHWRQVLQTQGEVDCSYEATDGQRFRINAFQQVRGYSLVLRVVPAVVRSLEDLWLPPALAEATQLQRGLVLVTGATGSGKSTTLAALIETINQTQPAHIITIEDPIEVLYRDARATVQQREIGANTRSFGQALRAALRQDPDVILVGELRDAETTATALMAAETGHLVLSTLHTKNAVDSLSRLLAFFPAEQHPSIRQQLSQSLEVVVSQRLVPRADGKGRVAAVELLVANALVREAIASGASFAPISDAIRKGSDTYGMQSFDQSLHSLQQQGVITTEEAVRQASSPADMRLRLQGIGE